MAGPEDTGRFVEDYIANDLPRKLQSMTLAELRELATAMRDPKVRKSTGVSSQQAEQVAAAAEQRMQAAPAGGGAMVTPAAATTPLAPATVQEPTGIPAPTDGQRMVGAQEGFLTRYGRPEVVLDPKLHPGAVPLEEATEGFTEPLPDTGGDMPLMQPPEGALPVEDVRAKPRPEGGPKTKRAYDGMKLSEFMEEGNVKYIAINGFGLRSEGGDYVPVNR